MSKKPDIPPCLVLQAELAAPASGQTYFAGSGPKRKGKKAAKRTPKKKEKKGSGSLAAFGVMPEGQKTLDEMTRQMPAGTQIAFAESWLERQNIESQTIDVTAHIDPSLSYEENVKNLKRQFGLGGGRSRQQAARGLTAAECDVAIGNFEAGFNHEVTRDACRCGHPDACEAKVAAAPKAKPKTTKRKTKKTAATPKLTASQREYLAIQGFVKVKRGGKYVKITR